ncbi:MAG: hypothetical protein LQ347_004851 [Umbilicaria vellea]|nr:MAG: hypothetical protein LQ347_004851 [Umbilicaria vellea]
MPFSLLRYGAIKPPLGYNLRPTRASTSLRLSLRFKTPNTTTCALSTAPAVPNLISEKNTAEPSADDVSHGVRPDQPNEGALPFEEDDTKFQEVVRRLKEDGEAYGYNLLYEAAEDGLPDLNSIAEAKQQVLDALYRADSEKLLHAFQRASRDETYVGSIPTTTFREILRLLRPEVFVDPYKEAFRYLHPNHVEQLGAAQFETMFLQFVDAVRDVTRMRRVAGFRLGTEEYKCILNCIRSGGGADAARAVWKGMLEDGVELDTPCYNLYFEALCWSNAFDPVESRKLRVIPYHMSMRLPVKWDQQRKAGFTGYLVGNMGIKQEVVKLFGNMVRTGIVADEKTFCLLMTAMAREGDTTGPKSILKKVWDVDVEALLSQDDNALQSAKIPPTTSPVYPSKQLLFTIAHIFGSNNDIPTALRVVDHVSRKFSLAISREVWAQLLEWTFVLASRRYGDRKSDGAQIGQLPIQSVERLWNTMVSEPYKVAPTMPMYNRLVRSYWTRDMVAQMLSGMRAGRRAWLYKRARLNRLVRLFGEAKANPFAAGELRTSSEAMRKQVRLLWLYEARDFAMVRGWVRLLLGGHRFKWEGVDTLAWGLRGLPLAIEEWGRFKPREGFTYSIHAGRLHFDPREELTMPVKRTESTLPGVMIVQHLEDGFQE